MAHLGSGELVGEGVLCAPGDAVCPTSWAGLSSVGNGEIGGVFPWTQAEVFPTKMGQIVLLAGGGTGRGETERPVRTGN